MGPELVPCGTKAGYERHRARTKRGLVDPPCEACRQAQRAYNRARYARRQAAKGITVQPRGPYPTRYNLQDIARMIRRRQDIERILRIKPDVVRALLHACRQNGLL